MNKAIGAGLCVLSVALFAGTAYVHSKLAQGQKKFTEGLQLYESKGRELENGKALLARSGQELAAGLRALEDGKQEILKGEERLRNGRAAYDRNCRLVPFVDQCKEGWKKIVAGEKKLKAGKARLSAGSRKVEEGRVKIAEGEKKVAEAERRLKDGERQLSEGRQRLRQAGFARAGALGLGIAAGLAGLLLIRCGRRTEP